MLPALRFFFSFAGGKLSFSAPSWCRFVGFSRAGVNGRFLRVFGQYRLRLLLRFPVFPPVLFLLGSILPLTSPDRGNTRQDLFALSCVLSFRPSTLWRLIFLLIVVLLRLSTSVGRHSSHSDPWQYFNPPPGQFSSSHEVLPFSQRYRVRRNQSLM